MNKIAKLFFTILITSLSLTLYAQTKVRGIITDAVSGEPLPFVNISFKGTTTGTISDFDGKYFLQSKYASDTICFSMVGYIPVSMQIQKNAFQELNIQLDPETYEMDEIVVHPGENPAWRIMRNVEANRKKNNPDRFSSYKYEVYNKMELDINNVKDEWSDKKILKNFDFVFNYADTSAETGKVYLPVFITESLSDVYHKSSPEKMKEVIKASRISGVERSNLSQYTGQMYIDVNIYDNYIPAFGHDFISPISDYWKINYKYYLLDSLYDENGKYIYHLSFKPKRKQEFTFTGELWINDSTWAVKKVKATMSKDVNLNYINNLIVTQEYTFTDSIWFLEKEELFLDFNLTDKTMGLFGRRTMTRRNIEINPDFPDNTFSSASSTESIVEEGAINRDTAYWNAARHEKLSQKEQNIYQMVDSIKEVPIFHTITNTVNMLIGGYWITKSWFEYGPYFKTFSSNPIEGCRFRVGGRTSVKFSEDVRLNGYVAYGLKDEKIKYGLGALYLLKRNPRRTMEVQYKYDYEQLGKSLNAFTEDNILATILKRKPNDHMLLNRSLDYTYEHEYFLGLSNLLKLQYKKLYPSKIIPFENESKNIFYSNITSYEATLTTHYAYNEKFVEGDFLRASMGSKYPTLEISATAGLWDNDGKYNDYYRFILIASQTQPINPIGRLKWIIEGGKIIGIVPFPLLKLHEGNETYVFDSYAFNLMNLYEFASDTYLSATLEHHFNGFFLNRIPLMRKLKWREIAYAKGLVGEISSKNSRENALIDFPTSLGNVHKPYLECGVGVENIFKFFRVDGVWRLTYLDHPDISKFAILLKAQFIL